MVYSNAAPCWPSNGNGNAFVLPVRRSDRETHLVVTVWDGSESLEEAIPVGKVHIKLSSFMSVQSTAGGAVQRDEAPPKYEYDVDLVPRLAELQQGEAKLTLMLERADAAFELESAKDQALADLLRRLGMARKKDRLKRLMQWDREYVGHGGSRERAAPSRDYSLVALLTQDPETRPEGSQEPDEGAPDERGGAGSSSQGAASLDDREAVEGASLGGASTAPVEGMVELLSEGQGSGRGRLVTAPVRAQAELLSRLKYVRLADGDVVMARGSFPNSFFYIVRGECSVAVDGEEVSRIDAGQFLGEIGVLYDSRRIADVRAVGTTELLVLNGEDIWLALDMFPGLYRELRRVAEVRIEQVQAREDWGEDRKANVDVSSGPLSEFIFFLQNIASEISRSASSSSLSRAAAQAGEALRRQDSESDVDDAAGSLRVSMPCSNSMSEGINIAGMAAAGDTRAYGHDGELPFSLDTRLYEQALSARLERMEQDGAFGSGSRQRSPADSATEAVAGRTSAISIPGRGSAHSEHRGTPTGGSARLRMLGRKPEVLAGSLRGAVMPIVGSLEHARRQGGYLSALSPQIHSGWDQSHSISSDEEGSDEESGAGGQLAATVGSLRMGEAGQTPKCVARVQDGDEEGAGTPGWGGASGSGRSPASDSPSDGDGEGSGSNIPRPRRRMFRLRFRKAHDAYTAEELGATPRRRSRLTISEVSVRQLKELDVSAYYTLEGSRGSPLVKSDVQRGDKKREKISWSDKVEMDVKDEALLPGGRLQMCLLQSRKLWSDSVVGYSLVSLQVALKRPGAWMQNTFELLKERPRVPREGSDETAIDDSHSFRSDSDVGAFSAGTASPTLPRSSSGLNLFGRLRGKSEAGEEDGARSKVVGTVTMTMLAEEPARLPFHLSVPPLIPGQAYYQVTDHTGKVVARLEYLGRSRCAWCTNMDSSAVFSHGYHDAAAGPSPEPCCAACGMKGWSECVVLWDRESDVRLGSVHTDVTPRKHSRARACDQNEAHFSSVRAACSSKPEVSTGVRFKIIPTFSELSVRMTGCTISGKSCQSSFQVTIKKPEAGHDASGGKGAGRRVGEVAADIQRGGMREPTLVLVQPGKDAVRSLLVALSINEACRLRPRSMYDGVTFRDKFDKEYARVVGVGAEAQHAPTPDSSGRDIDFDSLAASPGAGAQASPPGGIGSFGFAQ